MGVNVQKSLAHIGYPNVTSTLSPAEIDSLLAVQRYGHLGCSANGEVYVVPITYIFEAGVLYSFTELGKKIEMMRKNPKVCVQVEQVKAHDHWDSAICWGTFDEITDAEEKQRVKLLLADQFAQGEAGGDSVVSPLVSRLHETDTHREPILYKITIEKKTGRREKAI